MSRWFNLECIPSPGCEGEKPQFVLINVDNLDSLKECPKGEWPLYPIKSEVCISNTYFYSLNTIYEILGVDGSNMLNPRTNGFCERR
ncbi:MAG: hypothetical protein ACYSTS_19430 [Planctomycetota bacterium]|jgi:hypothetical protein